MVNYISKIKLKYPSKFRELIIIPIIYILLGNAISIIVKAVSNTNSFTVLFFPIDNSIFESAKLFTTSFILIVTIEYILYIKMPNNFLLSRVISIISMVLIMCSISCYLMTNSILSINASRIIAFIIALYIGQYISYFIQKLEYYKYEYVISLFLYICLISFYIYISINPFNNILFYSFV